MPDHPPSSARSAQPTSSARPPGLPTVGGLVVALLLLLLLIAPARAGGTKGAPDAAAAPTPDARIGMIHRALSAGDTELLLRAILAEYRAAGLEASDALVVHLQPPTKPISWYHAGNQFIDATRLLRAGEGEAYWTLWSKLLTGGRWSPAKEIGDAEAQRRLGSFALLGILAHEVAHHLDDRYWTTGETATLEEYQADTILVGLFDAIARDPELRKLRATYRRVVAGSLLDAIPDDLRPKLDLGKDLEPQFRTELKEEPKTPAGIVALQLTRQRELLDREPPPALPALAAHHRAAAHRWLAGRVLAPGWTLRTEPKPAEHLGAFSTLVVSRRGRVYVCRAPWRAKRLDAVTAGAGPDHVSLVAGTAYGGFDRAAVIEPSSLAPGGLAFLGPTSPIGGDRLRAVTTDNRCIGGSLSAGGTVRFSRLWTFRTPWGRAVSSVDGRALDLAGRVWVRSDERGTHTQAFFWLPIADEHASWELVARLRTVPKDEPCRDGPLAKATAHEVSFAVDAHKTVFVCETDPPSIRRISGGRIETIAGGLRGARDGDGRTAELLWPRALACAPDGSLWFLDLRPVLRGGKVEQLCFLRHLVPPR